MKQPEPQTQDPLVQAWAALEEVSSPSNPEDAKARFWQRFDEELGEEERRRQREAAMAKLSASEAQLPAYPEDAKARFWQRFDAELGGEERRRQRMYAWRKGWLAPLQALFQSQARWTAAGATLCLAALMVWGYTTPHHTKPQPAAHIPKTTAHKAPAPPTKAAPQTPALYKHMPMLQNLAMYENLDMHMDMQEQSDARKPKGS